ncbi:MAG: signal peptidase I, partial [candidate division NC10 bacterium]|nr:signal peptidase I [candidate division NC10 bacterium]
MARNGRVSVACLCQHGRQARRQVGCQFCIAFEAAGASVRRGTVTEEETKGRKAAPAAGQKSVLREYAEALIIAVLLALVIRTFVVQAFKIPSGSMLPTLQIGDHILVNKFIYSFASLK